MALFSVQYIPTIMTQDSSTALSFITKACGMSARSGLIGALFSVPGPLSPDSVHTYVPDMV